MSRPVRFHPAAQRDLAQLLDHLSMETSDRIARGFVDELVDYCLSFETFPERGTRHDDLHPGLRTVGWRRRATIAFTVTAADVVILRVLYAGRALALPSNEET